MEHDFPPPELSNDQMPHHPLNLNPTTGPSTLASPSASCYRQASQHGNSPRRHYTAEGNDARSSSSAQAMHESSEQSVANRSITPAAYTSAVIATSIKPAEQPLLEPLRANSLVSHKSYYSGQWFGKHAHLLALFSWLF